MKVSVFEGKLKFTAFTGANAKLMDAAIAKKILTLDPASMATMVSKLADSVTTDLDATSILTLATQFRGIDTTKDIYSGMEPTNSEYVNSTWYEICNVSSWQKMMTRVDQGLSPYEDNSQDATVGVAGSIGNGSDQDDTSEDPTSSDASADDSETTTTEVTSTAGANAVEPTGSGSSSSGSGSSSGSSSSGSGSSSSGSRRRN